MATRLILEMFGERQLDRTLARFEAVKDARPLWEQLAERFARNEERQFDTEGAYASGGWAALSPRYGAWKAQHYPGKPILERSGDLRRSLTRRPFPIEIISPAQMILGSDSAYGEFHQHGGPRLPQRRPVELPESERRTWAKMLHRFVVTGGASS